MSLYDLIEHDWSYVIYWENKMGCNDADAKTSPSNQLKQTQSTRSASSGDGLLGGSSSIGPAYGRSYDELLRDNQNQTQTIMLQEQTIGELSRRLNAIRALA